MAIAGPYNRITYSGTLPGDEVWSTSFNAAEVVGDTSTGQGGVTVLQEWAEAIAALYDLALPSFADGIWGAYTSLDTIRVEFRDIDDGLIEAAEAPVSAPLPAQPSNKPNQIAVVASLMTARAGRSYKGRMYWPALGASMVAATGRFESSYQSLTATDVASMLTDACAANPGTAVVVPVVLRQPNLPSDGRRVGR